MPNVLPLLVDQKTPFPPVLINASPKLNSIFFDKEEIGLTFDEYVTLKDINKQLIISPPLNSTQYKVYPVTGASKKVTLKLLDTLLDNTTYTFNFGESIIDFNESNPASYLTYTLSTGPTIDSLYIRGRVTDAFENETETIYLLTAVSSRQHLHRLCCVHQKTALCN